MEFSQAQSGQQEAEKKEAISVEQFMKILRNEALKDYVEERTAQDLPVPENIWFVYIVECNDGTLYTGITNDIPSRIVKHNKGKGAKYTRKRGPVKLRYWDAFESKGEALKEEIRIKKMKRTEKLKLVFPVEKEANENFKPEL